jgi:hypothetical protein
MNKHEAVGDKVRWSAASAKTEQSLERPCPSESVVLGHVSDIGEIAQTIIPFERYYGDPSLWVEVVKVFQGINRAS